MRQKISIIGAGSVGSTLAQRLLERNYADVVMFDIIQDMPQGKALDMRQAGALLGCDVSITGTNGYKDTVDSTIVVITSGYPRKPGMNSRSELFEKNREIVAQVTENVVRYSPDSIIIVVTNPLNAMAQVAYKVSGFSRERVLGMAGVLDAARMRSFISEELSVSAADIQVYVLGEHGESMVPLVDLCTVAGIPVSQLLPADRINKIIERTRNGGFEVIKLLGTGSSYFAPSAAILQMIDAVVLDKKSILSCAAYLQGEYGIRDLFLGVPVKLGAGGIEEIIEISLNKKEQAMLNKSAEAVKKLVGQIH